MNRIFFVVLLFCMLSCKGKHTEKDVVEVMNELRTIKIELADTAFRNVNQLLEMSSFVILANDEPLGDVKRIIVDDERAFVLDDTPKIVCYNMKGEIEYQINNKGGGPKEFFRLLDFTINKASNQLIAYDSGKRQLNIYNLKDGQFLSSLSTSTFAPMGMASVDGVFFFDNPDHFNYPDNKELHYSLLYSTIGNKIDNRFFEHDEISNYSMNYGEGHPFFYNNGSLLYNKRFDTMVYRLVPNKIIPYLNIELPNPLPDELLKDRIQPIELIKIDYSFGITNLYQCDDILYFWFSKSGFYQTVFYDLKKNKIIYAGNKVSNNPVKELPVFYPVVGVYQDCFFSLVSPMTILEKLSIDASVFPKQLQEISEDSNPVLMFYKVKK